MPAVASPPVAATANPGLRTLRWTALGTTCDVRYLPPAAERSPDFEAAVVAWVERFEARYSRFRPDSLVSRINLAAGAAWTEIDEEMEQLLDVCRQLHAMTDGILDATTGPLLGLWDYRRPHAAPPEAAAIAAARECVGWGLVERRRGAVRLARPGMRLDFGGWGKEWAVDAISALARSHGIAHALVDFGHDVRCLGRPPGRPGWHIGLEDPARPGTTLGSVVLFAGQGIASSGDYLRGFTHGGRRYGHIVDPRTGAPTTHGVRQVTVIAPNCFQAGVIATTAFVLGPAAGLEFVRRFPDTEALFISDHTRTQTAGFWRHVIT